MDSGLQVISKELNRTSLYRHKFWNFQLSVKVAQPATTGTSAGNVIVLNNNDLMQQRTSLGGQQVIIIFERKLSNSTELSIFNICFVWIRISRLFLRQMHHPHLQQQLRVKFYRQPMDN